VSGVVLSGTGIDVSGISGFQAIVARILSEMVPNLGLIRLDSAGISCDPAVVERYDTDPLVFRGKVPVRTAAELIASANRVRSSLDSITLPLLIVHGGADIVASPAGAQMIFDRASSIDKKLTIYDGLYHEILNEPEKDDVISDVVEWISARSTP
jgi:alpha-beta hydrolase superfamily lysophospholipase